MPPKSFVRRYDLGFEWMVMQIRDTKECQKSKLREAMPMPRYTDRFIYLGQARVRGQLCDHWREDLGEETVEYFETADEHVPLRLTTEAIDLEAGPERVTTPLMTYDFSRFESGPPDEALFKMASSTTSSIFARGWYRTWASLTYTSFTPVRAAPAAHAASAWLRSFETPVRRGR